MAAHVAMLPCHAHVAMPCPCKVLGGTVQYQVPRHVYIMLCMQTRGSMHAYVLAVLEDAVWQHVSPGPRIEGPCRPGMGLPPGARRREPSLSLIFISHLCCHYRGVFVFPHCATRAHRSKQACEQAEREQSPQCSPLNKIAILSILMLQQQTRLCRPVRARTVC